MTYYVFLNPAFSCRKTRGVVFHAKNHRPAPLTKEPDGGFEKLFLDDH